jgi:hypothetical protein
MELSGASGDDNRYSFETPTLLMLQFLDSICGEASKLLAYSFVTKINVIR